MYETENLKAMLPLLSRLALEYEKHTTVAVWLLIISAGAMFWQDVPMLIERT